MSSYWDSPGVATIRIKMIYWRKQLEAGRDDPKALEKFSQYLVEWEHVKEERKTLRQQRAAEKKRAAEAKKAKPIAPNEWKPLTTIEFQ